MDNIVQEPVVDGVVDNPVVPDTDAPVQEPTQQEPVVDTQPVVEDTSYDWDSESVLKPQSTPNADVSERIANLEAELRVRDLQRQSERLREQHGDSYNEEAVVKQALKMGIYDNLEFVFNGMQKANPVDVEAIKKQAIQEYISSGDVPQSIIGGTDTPQQTTSYADKLNYSEKEYCKKMGYSAEEYYNMKNADYSL